MITALKQRAITLTINGNEGLSYQDAQSQIANNQWDIVFRDFHPLSQFFQRIVAIPLLQSCFLIQTFINRAYLFT